MAASTHHRDSPSVIPLLSFAVSLFSPSINHRKRPPPKRANQPSSTVAFVFCNQSPSCSVSRRRRFHGTTVVISPPATSRFFHSRKQPLWTAVSPKIARSPSSTPQHHRTPVFSFSLVSLPFSLSTRRILLFLSLTTSTPAPHHGAPPVVFQPLSCLFSLSSSCHLFLSSPRSSLTLSLSSKFRFSLSVKRKRR